MELNAIDLAWDTVVRFSRYGLPEAFYADFARWGGGAAEEVWMEGDSSRPASRSEQLLLHLTVCGRHKQNRALGLCH